MDITVNVNPKHGKKLINSDENEQKEWKIKEEKKIEKLMLVKKSKFKSKMNRVKTQYHARI